MVICCSCSQWLECLHYPTCTSVEKINPIQLVFGFWLGLFFLFVPFPFEFIPEIGSLLTKLFLPVTKAISGDSVTTISETHSFSDSIHLYIQTLLLGIVSTLFAWITIRKHKTNSVTAWLRLGVAYVLAFFLIKYAIEKFTQLQFPQPPPNILHAPTGSLDKDILFWTLMGTSKSYGWFMGLTEILSGVLLLFHRTRYLGALLAIGVFANIFAINIGFNITVKLLSFVLMSAAIYVFLPALLPMIKLLTGNKNSEITSAQTIEIKPLFKRILKGAAVALIALECGVPVVEYRAVNLESDPLLNKTFSVVEIVDSELFPGNQPIRQIHFHPQGFLITESYDGDFKSYPITLPAGSGQFKLQNTDLPVTVQQKGKDWLFFQNQSLLLKCRRVDNQSLPLLQDDFNWTVESMAVE